MFKVSSIVLTVALFGCASASASAVISGDRCSATTPCSNNLCCSEYGFCGSTYAFCGPGCQSGPCDPRGVSQDFTVFDMNKPGLASVVDVDDANPLNSFDNLLATNGKQGYCQPWGSGGGDLCREEKTLAACSGYDGLYYLPYKSQAEVATKCLEEPKCKGFTWDTNLKKGKLKSRIDSVYGSNRRWNCFKKLESAIMACPNFSDSKCSYDGTCACYDPRELRINYPTNGVNCYACVMPDYTPLQCKNDLDCDVRNSKCEIVRADYTGRNPLSNKTTMCIPKAGAAIGKPCYTGTLCASGSCLYVDRDSQKGECIQEGVHSEEE